MGRWAQGGEGRGVGVGVEPPVPEMGWTSVREVFLPFAVEPSHQ